MENTNWIEALFESIDRMDIDTFLGYFVEDSSFRFGNAEPVTGKQNIGIAVEGFFSSIKALRHEVLEYWQQENAVLCHGYVTYTRHDNSTLRVPFANIFKMQGKLIKDYLIFVDVSQLYQ